MLVNNFGVINFKSFINSSDNSIEKKFKINTLAHFWVIFKIILQNYLKILDILVVSCPGLAYLF